MVRSANPFQPSLSGVTVPFSTSSIPTTLTQIFANDCWLRGFLIANPTNGNINVQIQDGNGIYIVPPNDPLVPGGFIAFEGVDFMTGGIFWQASAPGLHGRGRYTL